MSYFNKIIEKIPLLTKDIIWLTIILAALLMVSPQPPYHTPTEARYVEISQEMLKTGDLVTPRINGVKFLDKPPLTFWLGAASISMFGSSEFSARLPHALLMIALCLIIFAAGRKFYGRIAGVLGALIMASCVMGVVSGRIVMTDLSLSFFITACLLSFMFSQLSLEKRKRDIFLMLTYVSAALAVLSKGIVGILIPAIVVGSWIAITWQWQILKNARLVWGTLLFTIIVVPWHILAGFETKEFYDFYFINQHFQRFFTDIHQRTKFFGFFFVVVIAGLFPWIIFLFQTLNEKIKKLWRERHIKSTANNIEIYLLLWAALPFLFFSYSDSKNVVYILPVFPPLALMIGNYLSQIWNNGLSKKAKGFYTGLYILAGSYMLIVIGYFTIYFLKPLIVNVEQGILEKFSTLTEIAIALIAGTFSLWLSFLLWQHKNQKTIITHLTVFTLVFMTMIYSQITQKIFGENSTKVFAEFLLPRLNQSDEVVTYKVRYNDILVYLNRKITIVDEEDELEFGVSVEPRTREWMIDKKRFALRWNKPNHKIYLVIQKKRYDGFCKIYCTKSTKTLLENSKNILITNF